MIPGNSILQHRIFQGIVHQPYNVLTLHSILILLGSICERNNFSRVIYSKKTTEITKVILMPR
jgi:hypothetical protein